MISSQRGSGDSRETHPNANEDLRASLAARQRHLRSMLVDARDALVRRKLGVDATPPGHGHGPGSSRGASDGNGDEYAALRARLRQVVRSLVPIDARVAVVSRGDARLLDLGGERTAWHFPRDGDGAYAGHHPADSRAAIQHLEDLRRRGAQFLVFPATSLWWLEHYVGLRRHLDRRYRGLVHDARTGAIYDLGAPALDAVDSEEAGRERASAQEGDRPPAAVTIISRNYLAQARVLARSFLEHEPGGRFYLLVVDRLPDGEDVGVDVEIIDPEELDIPNLWEMCFKYGIVEFNTAVKPFLLSLLLRQYGEDEIVYFDPDILIMRRLTELREALARGPIVLTPHIMRPVPLDGRRPSEQDIMISGAYNLGFIALRHSEETERFLGWWEERLQDGCRIDVEHGLFTDQKWIDLVPSLFPSTVVLRDPSYNVAFWNLHERSVSRRGNEFLVDGRPAAFFHVSGFDPAQPEKLSKHQNRIEVVEGTALAELLETYADLLLANGYREAKQWEYGHAFFENGIRVHPLLRQLYLNLPPEDRGRFGNPFSTSGTESFLDWATRPRPEDGKLSRFLEAMYRMRYDLPLAFPDVRGTDRKSFLAWARRWGSKEMGFEPELVRDELVVDAAVDVRPVPSDRPPASAERKDRTAAVAGPGKATPARAPGQSAGSTQGKTIADPHERGPHEGGPATRPPATSYRDVLLRIRDIARATLPAGSRVLVVSKGDYRLVDLGGSEGWHFPQTEDGTYGGFHPPDSDVAIAHLEALRGKGANYLLIPQTALWWLEYYEGFRQHLESRYRPVVQDHETCVIYSLRAATNGNGAGRRDLPLWRRWLKQVGGHFLEGGTR